MATPEQIAQKHADRLKGANQLIRDGVDNVTEAPGKKAAAKADKMLAGIQEAVTSGKWAERVASVSLEDWKTSMLDKGIGRISAGVDAAMEKTTEFHKQLQAHQTGYLSKLRSKPDLTLSDSIQRMVSNVEEMAKFRFKR